MDKPLPTSLPPEAEAALRAGKKIEAIRIVREHEGLGLAEAKERVERFEAADPLLARTAETRKRAANRGCLMFLIALIILAIAAYTLYTMQP